MRIGQVRDVDVANGPGVRTSFFVTGCHFNCFNCFNKEYQDFNYGELADERLYQRLSENLKRDYIQGLSILGGEPMEHARDLLPLIKDLKKDMRKDQDIWLWSGYTLEAIVLNREKMALLEEIDILVDGLFENDKKDLTLQFRGSSNQRIIDVQTTLKEGLVTMWSGLNS